MTDNSILGNTQQAAVEATTARQATKVAWQDNVFTHIGVAIFLIIAGYVIMTSLDWNFFLKLLVGIAIFWTGGKVTNWVGIKLAWKWPGILRGVGTGIILLALIQSGFYALVAKGVNAIEQKAAVAAGTAAPKVIAAPSVQYVIWVPGELFYPEPGVKYRGEIPPEGVIFEVPVRHKVRSSATVDVIPQGPKENPWATALFRPQDGKGIMTTIEAYKP